MECRRRDQDHLVSVEGEGERLVVAVPIQFQLLLLRPVPSVMKRLGITEVSLRRQLILTTRQITPHPLRPSSMAQVDTLTVPRGVYRLLPPGLLP